MNYYSVFYWLTVADGVKSIFDVFSNIFTFFTVLSLIVYVIIIGVSVSLKLSDDAKQEEYKESLVWRKFFGKTYWICQIICILTWLGYVLTPTKKDCIMIVAGGAVGNFITTDSSTKSLPSDVAKYLHLSLNKEIEDLSKETKQDIKKELGVQSPKERLLDKAKQMTKDELINYLQTDSTIIK